LFFFQLKWVSLADTGLQKSDGDALCDFVSRDPHLEYLDLSGSSFGSTQLMSKLAAALPLNYHLQTLVLYNCNILNAHADALFAGLANQSLGLRIVGIAKQVNPAVDGTTLVLRAKGLDTVAPTALQYYNTVVGIDCHKLDLRDETLIGIPFLESLLFQRCDLGKGICYYYYY
jgi:hypothetical protein